MCTTSSKSSSFGFNQKNFAENENDLSSYFDNESNSDEENEENYFQELDYSSNENIIDNSKDGQFGKVHNNFYF